MGNLECTFVKIPTNNPNLKGLRMALLADLHASDNAYAQRTMEYVLAEPAIRAADQVLFLGDLVQETSYLRHHTDELAAWFEALGGEQKVIAITGNHDIRRIDPADGLVYATPIHGWTVWKEICTLWNEPAARHYGQLVFMGMQQSPEYFGTSERFGSGVIGRNTVIQENYNLFKRDLNEFLRSIGRGQLESFRRRGAFTVLMVHAGRYIDRPEVRRTLAPWFDLVLSAHAHDYGLSDPLFRQVLKLTGRGFNPRERPMHFIAPPLQTFANPRYQRHYHRKYALLELV